MVKDSRLPTVALPVEDGRYYLWNKTREAFRYIYERGYLDSVGWVVKADDDTYVVVENLRQYVSEMDPAQALLLGLRIKGYSSKGFMSGGAGYVLSREAVRVFVTQALHNVRCNTDELQFEDVAMGICLEDAGVSFVDTRDAYGKQRFYGSSPYAFVSNDRTLKWMRYMMVDEYPQGPKFGSRSAISFHYISPTDMYVMDYLLYGLDVSKA